MRTRHVPAARLASIALTATLGALAPCLALDDPRAM